MELFTLSKTKPIYYDKSISIYNNFKKIRLLFMRKYYLHLFFIASAIMLISCNEDNLPNNVTLNPLTEDSTGVTLSWSESNDNSFVAYNIYRNTTSGIDNNSNLIHVETSQSTTTFKDSMVDPLQKYFYRVYVVNDDGISTGSNIESIFTTLNGENIVNNSSFENTSAGSLDDWNLEENLMGDSSNFIIVDNTTSSDGSQSLKFHHDESTGCWEMWIYQYISIADLTSEATYRFSIDYKSNTAFTSQSGMGLRIFNSEFNIQVPMATFNGDGSWHTYTDEFTLPANISGASPQLMIHFCNQGIVDWWIDNIKVERIQ